MPRKSSEYIKCRFCNWEMPRFYTNKKGKVRSNWHRLEMHVERCHPKDYDKITNQPEVEKFFEENPERKGGGGGER